MTMLKVIMGYGGFYSCLIEPRGITTWQKETTQTCVFLLSPFDVLNHLEPQSSKTKQVTFYVTNLNHMTSPNYKPVHTSNVLICIQLHLHSPSFIMFVTKEVYYTIWHI